MSGHSYPGPASRCAPGRGFTLIELLVVISIITILLALLLPVAGRSRASARMAVCLANLHGVGQASELYAQDFKDRYPDALTLGNHSFRQAPGTTTPGDPGALPETYGLAAALDRHGSIAGNSPAWVCPGQTREYRQIMRDGNNTYAYNLTAGKYDSFERGKRNTTTWVYDNTALKAGLTGFNGPFGGYTIPAAQKKWPHPFAKETQGINTLFLDGRAVLQGSVMDVP